MERLSIAIWLASQERSIPNQATKPVSMKKEIGKTSALQQNLQQENWVDLHLNFWIFPNSITIDIGILFPCINQETVKIYINNPDITDENVKEITKDYLEQEDIRDLIFNDKLSIKNECHITGSGHCLSAKKSEDNEEFCLNFDDHKLEVNESKYNGIIINLKLANRDCVEKINKVYSRLRISGDILKNIFPFTKDPTSYLQYHTIEYKFIDLRINDSRTLPRKLVDDNRILPVIRRLRCFIMLNANLQMICTSNRYERVRSLEKELWARYINITTKTKEPILAYQWNADSTQNKSIKNFSLFLKIRKNYVKKLTAFGVLLLIIILGIIASCLANFIDHKFDMALKKEPITRDSISSVDSMVEQVMNSINNINDKSDQNNK